MLQRLQQTNENDHFNVYLGQIVKLHFRKCFIIFEMPSDVSASYTGRLALAAAYRSFQVDEMFLK